MRVTINNVNAALRSAGIDAELVRGDGYFWFDGPDVERAYTSSVMTAHLTSMSVEEWVARGREFAEESKSK